MSALAQLAAAQHGTFSRRQALAAGVSSTGISRHLAAGRWRAIDDGVYVLPGAGRAGWLQSVMAACLATGGCASHQTAARLWGLPLPKRDAAIDVLVPAARRPRSTRAVRVHRTRGAIAPVLRGSIPTAPLKEALLQLGEVLDEAALTAAIEAGLQEQPGLLYALADTLVEARRGHRSSLRFRDLIVALLPDDGAREALAARLPRGAVPHAGLDFAWPRERVGVALFDHRDHGQGAALDALKAEGWGVLVTHAREDPKQLLGRIRRLRPHFR